MTQTARGSHWPSRCRLSQTISASRACRRNGNGPSVGPFIGDRSAYQSVPEGSTWEALCIRASPNSNKGASSSSHRNVMVASGAMAMANALLRGLMEFGGLLILGRLSQRLLDLLGESLTAG